MTEDDKRLYCPVCRVGIIFATKDIMWCTGTADQLSGCGAGWDWNGSRLITKIIP